jgi:peptidoglycan/LPS O-acetylase OafA/YrhL
LNSVRSNKKIVGLDSLRFFAFLAVFLFHTTNKLKYGYLGVDFFFVLSSFLLTFLAFKEIKYTGGFSKLNFFIRRAVRIFPLYYFIVFGALIVLPFIANQMGIQITLPDKKYLYWFLLPNYDYSDCIYALKFLWSIGVEEQFYLLFIALSFLFIRYFWVSLLILFSAYFIFMTLAESYQLNTFTNTLAHFSDFAVGMLTGYFYFNRRYKLKWVLPALIILTLTIIIFDFNEMFFHLFVSIWFALIILSYIKIAPDLNRFFLFKIPEYLGKYTYGLYVYSGFVITFGAIFLPVDNAALLISLELIITIIVAFFSYQLFEKRFLAYKKYFR